jgi:hypothetical protein
MLPTQEERITFLHSHQNPNDEWFKATAEIAKFMKGLTDEQRSGLQELSAAELALRTEFGLPPDLRVPVGKVEYYSLDADQRKKYDRKTLENLKREQELYKELADGQ